MNRALQLQREWKLRIVPKQPKGSVVPVRTLSFREILKYGFPFGDMPKHIRAWKRKNIKHLWRGMQKEMAARVLKVCHLTGSWCLVIVAPDGTREDYGLTSMRVITTNGAEFVVDAFQGSQTLSNMRYPGIGQGATLESASDSGLSNELTTQYNPDNTRATGTVGEGASSTIFRVTSLIDLDASISLTEMGIFSQASTLTGTPTGGYMLDRALQSTVTVLAAFAVQPDFRLTIATGT